MVLDILNWITASGGNAFGRGIFILFALGIIAQAALYMVQMVCATLRPESKVGDQDVEI